MHLFDISPDRISEVEVCLLAVNIKFFKVVIKYNIVLRVFYTDT
jgi:hypothetical protein